MSRLPAPSAVVFVADVERMTRFYQTVAAMTLLSGDAAHSVLEVEHFQLVIHALSGEPKVVPGPNGEVPVRGDTYIKVCLPVRSLSAARTLAASLGGLLQPAEREWVAEARGFRACDGHDPEGNVFQLRESVLSSGRDS